MNEKPIIIVQGAQWGSEGKGMVAAALCERRGVDYAVRTGAVNAGHTVIYRGQTFKMQQLPTGWINGDRTRLVLGAGAYIHPEQFFKEISAVRMAGYNGMIYVDHRAGLHLPEHQERAGKSGRHYTIGATGKGCSEAILDRIRLRGRGGPLFRDWLDEHRAPEEFILCDTAQLLNTAYDRGEQILLEGTQGTLLDLYLGPYPYTTHKQCTAAQWVVEAGLSPNLQYETILVARTYPIRVAGNSGPMNNEISWPVLATEMNAKMLDYFIVDPVAIDAFQTARREREGKYPSELIEASEANRDALESLSPDTRQELAKLFEYTTVTKKLRRIARLDMDDLKYSVMLNRPTSLCVSFLNYEFPEMWGHDTQGIRGFLVKAHDYLRSLGEAAGVEVRYTTTGPRSEHFIDLRG